MGFLNSEGLEYLVNKLSDSSNIKIAGNPNGTRVGAVVDKLVEKTDTVTGAVDMEIENEVGSFKVGTGLGSTDVSATVEDGFSEIEIKGNTVQNLVLEDNVEVVPSGAMVSAEATSLKLDTASGNVDMSIKGRTLQNLEKYLSPNHANDSDYSYRSIDVSMFKVGTTYTAFIIPGGDSIGYFRIAEAGASNPQFPNTSVKNRAVFTFKEIIKKPVYLFCAPINGGALNSDDLEKTKMVILEGDYTNTPLSELPYVDGIQSVGEQEDNVVEVSSVNSNIFDRKIEDVVEDSGATFTKINDNEFTVSYAVDTLSRCVYKDFIGTGEPITISLDTKIISGDFSSSLCIQIRQENLGTVYSNKVLPNTTDYSNTKLTFTTPKGEKYWILLYKSRKEHPSCVVGYRNIKMEYGTTATPYEPYQGDTAQITLEEPLRSLPNGVCDEIVDGKLIRRIGKIVLDGNESGDWRIHSERINTMTFQRNNSFGKKNGLTNLITNTLPTIEILWAQDILSGIGGSGNNELVYVTLLKSKLSTQDITGFKKWLQANPTTVYYELATPVITELGQSINLDTYIGTTHMTSTNYLSPKIKVNSKGKAYETLLKPNTDYTVKWRAAEGGANLDLNLGGTAKTVDKTLGSTTIKTPTTLADSNLYVAGWGSKVRDVMVVEGNLGNTPFVEGIVGVGEKSKNLFSPDNIEIGTSSNVVGKTWKEAQFNSTTRLRVIKEIDVCPNTTYILSNCKSLQCVVKQFNDKGIGVHDINWMFGNYSFTTSSETRKLAFMVKYSDDRNITLSDIVDANIQLEESSTATPYEPYYDGHKIEILSNGKNLLDRKNCNENYTLTWASGVLHAMQGALASELIKVFEGESYILSHSGAVVLFDENKKYLKMYNGQNAYRTSFNIGGANSCSYVRLAFRSDQNNSKDMTKENVQLLNYSSSLIPYEPYKEDKSQILLDKPLMKLPNGVADEITHDGKLIRRVGKCVANGTDETIKISNLGTVIDTLYFEIMNIPNLKHRSDSTTSMCDRFPTHGEWQKLQDKENVFTDVNYNLIGIKILRSKLSTQDLEGIRKWLSQNNTVIYYELAEPTITELEPLKARLFKDGHLTFNTLVAPTSTHRVLLNKSAQIEQSVREIQSLDGRVGKLESFYDDMILETSHKLSLLDLDFDYIRESEEE